MLNSYSRTNINEWNHYIQRGYEAAPPAVKPPCVTPQVSFTFPFKCGLCECHACCGQHVNTQQTKHAALCSVVRITQRRQLFQVLFFGSLNYFPSDQYLMWIPVKWKTAPVILSCDDTPLIGSMYPAVVTNWTRKSENRRWCVADTKPCVRQNKNK